MGDTRLQHCEPVGYRMVATIVASALREHLHALLQPQERTRVKPLPMFRSSNVIVYHRAERSSVNRSANANR
ncbi:unnamed protein product [Prunus armeniaca]|uniref:Uncharacterized protein n=1 Tax=Prunus armeniaca TaxID=36596 RepID=A0A6J5WW80_PRUAR|nr:unnamed protein product [Prunus armeniaca]